MARFHKILWLLPLVGWLGACSTFDTSYDAGPVVIGGSQTGLTVRYDPAKVEAAEVDKTAVAFCRAYDKKPLRRGKSELMPDVVYQAYDCVAPTATSPAK